MKKAFIILFSVFCLFSCKNSLDLGENDNQKTVTSEEIVLGEKRKNPFSISNERMALSAEEINYVYFRIRLTDIENAETLEKYTGDLNTVPLDYEIKEGGCIYSENSGSDVYTPWFYIITTLETFKKVEMLGEVEILDEMYISEEDMTKFTEVDGLERDNDARFLWFNKKTARPTGYVYFYDEVRRKNVALKGVKVTVSQWCYSKSVYTDENGYYDIGEDFTSFWQNTANVKVTFETRKDTVYPGGSIVKASYNAGDKSILNLHKNDICLKKDTKQNLYGILTNATTEYRNYVRELGITEPQNLKFWACDNMNGGITLMRDVITADSASAGAIIGTCICPGAGTIVGTLIGSALGIYAPDIMISLNASYKKTKTESITECVFHEMAHASHYTGIGFGKITYWNEEYLNMIGGWLSVLFDGGSPFENCYNDGASEQVCFIESWGYFIGFYLTMKYYDGYETFDDYEEILKSNLYYNELKFLYYYVFYDLLDTLSIAQIFEPYKYFQIQSISDWYKKLLSLNSSIDSDGRIKNTFKEYGISL